MGARSRERLQMRSKLVRKRIDTPFLPQMPARMPGIRYVWLKGVKMRRSQRYFC